MTLNHGNGMNTVDHFEDGATKCRKPYDAPAGQEEDAIGRREEAIEASLSGTLILCFSDVVPTGRSHSEGEDEAAKRAAILMKAKTILSEGRELVVGDEETPRFRPAVQQVGGVTADEEETPAHLSSTEQKQDIVSTGPPANTRRKIANGQEGQVDHVGASFKEKNSKNGMKNEALAASKREDPAATKKGPLGADDDGYGEISDAIEAIDVAGHEGLGQFEAGTFATAENPPGGID